MHKLGTSAGFFGYSHSFSRGTAMSIGGMVTMDGFDLAFKCPVFVRLPSLTIDVFPTNAQCIGAKRFLLRLPHYFDFFERALPG